MNETNGNNSENNLRNSLKNIKGRGSSSSSGVKSDLKIAKNALSGNIAGAVKEAIKSGKLKGVIKKKLIKFGIIALVFILIVATFFAIANKIKEEVVNIFSSIGSTVKGFMGKLWQNIKNFFEGDNPEDDYWVDLTKKTTYILDKKTGENLAYKDPETGESVIYNRQQLIDLIEDVDPKAKISAEDLLNYSGDDVNLLLNEYFETEEKNYTLVDNYVKELGNQGINIKDLRLLGQADYSIEEILDDETNKSKVEKYIAEFIRADIITQQPHRTSSEVNVYADKQEYVDGGIYLWRTTDDAVFSDDSFDSAKAGTQTTYLGKVEADGGVSGNSEELENDPNAYVQMKYVKPEEYLKELGIPEDKTFSSIYGQELEFTDEKVVDKLKYTFTQDPETEQLVITKVTTRANIDTNYSEPLEGINDSLKKAKKNYTVTVTSFDYKSMIAKYAMPYEFLINLCQITQNPEFVYHVALLARDTKIVIAINDDIGTLSRETNDEYTKYEDFYNGSSDSVDGASRSNQRETKERSITYIKEQEPIYSLKYINTWNYYEEYTYLRTVTTTLEENREGIPLPTTIPERLSYHISTYTNEEGIETKYGYWADSAIITEHTLYSQLKTATVSYSEPIICIKSKDGGKIEEAIEKSDQFLGLLKNSTGKCPTDCFTEDEPKTTNDIKALQCIDESKVDFDGKNVQYKIPNMTRTEPPLNKLQSGIEMLYAILQSNDSGYSPNETKYVSNSSEVNSKMKEYVEQGDYTSAYVVRMQYLVEHLRYLMSCMENEIYEKGYVERNLQPIDIYNTKEKHEYEKEEEIDNSIGNIQAGQSALWQNNYTKQQFEMMVIAYASKLSGKQLDGYNKFFVPYAAQFFDIATSYGIDPMYIFCKGINESGWGTSAIANAKGNVFGYGAYDDSPMSSAWEFDSMQGALNQVCGALKKYYIENGGWQHDKIIANGYDPTTIDGIETVYASAGLNSSKAIKSLMKQIFGTKTAGGSSSGGNKTNNDTNPSTLQENIIDVAKNYKKYGIGAEGGYCLQWVNDVYQAAGAPVSRVSTASEAGHYYGVSTDMSNIPIGAAIYGLGSYSSSVGHVGIYIGNNKVLSCIGDNNVKEDNLNDFINYYNAKCWGWCSKTDETKQGLMAYRTTAGGKLIT